MGAGEANTSPFFAAEAVLASPFLGKLKYLVTWDKKSVSPLTQKSFSASQVTGDTIR